MGTILILYSVQYVSGVSLPWWVWGLVYGYVMMKLAWGVIVLGTSDKK